MSEPRAILEVHFSLVLQAAPRVKQKRRSACIQSAGESEPAIRWESEFRGLLWATLEAAGVEFIDENGGGAGVRLRKK